MNEERTINKLPKDWKWVKLGDVCQKVEAVKRKEKNPEEELLYLDIGGIDNASYKILNHKNYKWKDAPSRAQQIVLKDDILFSTVRTYMKNIAVVEDKIYDGQIASSGFCVIRSDRKFTNPKFIFYYTVSERFLRPLNELQTGSSYPAVRDKDVFSQPFPLPSKEVQAALVSKIEELFSEIDKGVEEIKTAQQQLKVYRQAVLKWAFEGKLTNDDFVEGELPKGWTRAKLKDVAKKITDGEHATPKRTSEGVLLLSARNVHNGELRLEDVDYVGEEEYQRIIKRCYPEGDDILISCSGSVGRVCRVPKNLKFVMVRSVALVKLDWNRYSSKYFEYMLQSSQLQKQIEKGKKATAQANLFLGPINNLEAIICPLEEQQKIVQEIESRLSVCDKIEVTITNSLKQAEALRQSILKKAFEGTLN